MGAVKTECIKLCFGGIGKGLRGLGCVVAAVQGVYCRGKTNLPIKYLDSFIAGSQIMIDYRLKVICAAFALLCLVSQVSVGQEFNGKLIPIAEPYNNSNEAASEIEVDDASNAVELARPLARPIGPVALTPTLADPDVDAKGCESCGACEQCSPITEVGAQAIADFPSVNVTGFFHLDSAYYDQDTASRLTLGDIDDGLGFRRARLAAAGSVTDDVSYILEFDFAQSQARFVDVWMQLEKTQFGNVRIGRFRQPFGMSELTSVRDLPFLERPLTFAQSPFRQTGIMIFDTFWEEAGTWAMSGYRFLSDNFGNVFADSGGYGMASRITKVWEPFGDGRIFHAGFDYSYNDPGGGLLQIVSTNELFVGQNPNLGPAGLSVLPIVAVPPFVNSGPIATNSAQFFNIELAAANGPIAVQSEVRLVRVDPITGASFDLPGAYAQVRYVLTGEHIPYNGSGGVFGRVVPQNNFGRCGGTGAWELLARISHIDLNDMAVTGRRLTNWTVGCNWYWNKYTKMQFNWIRSRLNDVAIGDSETDAVAFRVQLDF